LGKSGHESASPDKVVLHIVVRHGVISG